MKILDTHPDALRWDQRYADKNDAGNACRALSENLHLLPHTGQALDLACGLGANALLLARQGLDVQAWDISAIALNKLQHKAQQQGLQIQCQQRDLRTQTAAPHSFDVIVVSYFLEREIMPALVEALRPDGLLYYQTFSRLRVDDSGPDNPQFRLAENELLQHFSGLKLRVYREDGLTGDPLQGLRNEVIYIGQKHA